MGLSASSLRIAMLTARKSSLEFEGQQINQQRLTLSNQSAALFNSMLTMQVPTPPDPSEFSKMVYTFNKGNGLSEIINVSKNISGGYTHDVTYKSPKTDSVLMKKQLNNVGFKSVNGQMSAVIDGINYDLTLNGDKEKLDEYLKTKETYDNIKNIETQMASLQKMSSTKELTSQQMKQYFETLGLSSVETPQMGNVLDVQTIDDAFRNVYNEGNGYSYQNVTLTYTSSTSPITLDPSKRNLLKVADNTGILTMGADNKHYTYITKCAPASTQPTLSNPITYNITQDDSGNWSWTLNNVSNDVLNAFEITYEKKVCTTQGNNLSPTTSFISIDDVSYQNIEYSEGKWTWNEVRSVQYFQLGSEYIDIQGKQSCKIGDSNYDIQTIGGITYFQEQTISPIEPKETPVIEHWMEQGGKIGYDIDRNGKIDDNEFIDKNGSKIIGDGDNAVTYSISKDKDNQWQLKVSSAQMFAAWQDNTDCLTGIKDKDDWYRVPDFNGDNIGYWYNTQTKRVEIINDAVNVDKKDIPDGDNWVWVSKNNQDKWEYTINLSDVPQFEHNGKELNKDDNGNWYQDVDVKNDGKNDYQNVYTRDKNGSWSTQKRYTDTQLGGNIVIKEERYEKSAQELPEGILKDNRKIGIQYSYDGENSSWSEENASVDIARYTIQQDTSGNFNLSGQGLPSGVAEKSASEGDSIQYQGTSNGVTYYVVDNGQDKGDYRYSISASFKTWVNKNDTNEKNYIYDQTNHTLSLTTPTGVIAQMLLRNNNNERNEDCDRNITVNEMLGFYEEILKQFGLYGSSQAYKIKLDTARSNYLSTIDAQGVENPEENQALFNFIDTNGKSAYIYVPLDYINKDGQVDSTYAYMYETSYLENQTETISQKANIIYDENGRIAKITFDDGTVVIPEVKTEQDEEAYNSAMVKYDYEKQQYDKEISDINAKTEVIAQQDKNLEIKLKSIDTQHTAIQTEIEALNKVLENNVKSSFGTFSA